jgi:hypothetical protein
VLRQSTEGIGSACEQRCEISPPAYRADATARSGHDEASAAAHQRPAVLASERCPRWTRGAHASQASLGKDIRSNGPWRKRQRTRHHCRGTRNPRKSGCRWDHSRCRIVPPCTSARGPGAALRSNPPRRALGVAAIREDGDQRQNNDKVTQFQNGNSFGVQLNARAQEPQCAYSYNRGGGGKTMQVIFASILICLPSYQAFSGECLSRSREGREAVGAPKIACRV